MHSVILDLFAWCVRLSRLLVGFRTHFKSLHFLLSSSVKRAYESDMTLRRSFYRSTSVLWLIFRVWCSEKNNSR